MKEIVTKYLIEETPEGVFFCREDGKSLSEEDISSIPPIIMQYQLDHPDISVMNYTINPGDVDSATHILINIIRDEEDARQVIIRINSPQVEKLSIAERIVIACIKFVDWFFNFFI